MGIRKAGVKKGPSERTRVKLEGESLLEAASRVFGEARLLPLFVDLNPEIGAGKTPPGTVIVVPSQAEARKFAAQMGFSIGFDPSKGGSTKAKRKWTKMQSGGPAPRSKTSPGDLARVFREQGLAPDQAARRMTALCEEAALDAYIASADPADAPFIEAIESMRFRRQVREMLNALVLVLDRTTTPTGLEALALFEDPGRAVRRLRRAAGACGPAR